MRIGELLIKAGIVSEEQLQERLSLAKAKGMPFGMTLVQAGDLTSYQLLGTVQVQSLLSDGRLTVESAVEAIQFICREDLGLDDALRRVGSRHEDQNTCKLGELLVEAGAITQGDLFTALASSFETCLPLGASLINRQAVAPNIVQVALSLQAGIRQQKVRREDAVSHLKSLLLKSRTDDQSQAHAEPQTRLVQPPSPAEQGVKAKGQQAQAKKQAETKSRTKAKSAEPVAAYVEETIDDVGQADPVSILRRRARQAEERGNYAEAEKHYAAALNEAEKSGEHNTILMHSLAEMADFYVKRGEMSVAKSLLGRALIIGGKFLAPDDPFLGELRRKHEWVRLREQGGGSQGLTWIP